MSEELKVGGELDAWCTTCRLMKWHTIVALVDGKPAKVECQGCGKQHQYRAQPPGAGDKGEKPPRAPRARAAKSAAAATPPVEFEALLAGRDGDARPYSPNDTYALNDVVRHPTFDLGVVTATPAPQKIEVTFRGGGKKILLHDRGAAAGVHARPAAAPRRGGRAGRHLRLAARPEVGYFSDRRERIVGSRSCSVAPAVTPTRCTTSRPSASCEVATQAPVASRVQPSHENWSPPMGRILTHIRQATGRRVLVEDPQVLVARRQAPRGVADQERALAVDGAARARGAVVERLDDRVEPEAVVDPQRVGVLEELLLVGAVGDLGAVAPGAAACGW